MNKCKALLMTPKPYKDESLAGYILRLTEENFYEKVSEIYILADLRGAVKSKSNNGNLINPLVDNMEKLSDLVKCSVKDLIKMTFASNDVNSSFFLYRNLSISRESIHTTKTKICPECLSENAYHRKAWDLVAVTACVRHKKILIDKCPKCCKEITWARVKVLECSCGQLLTEIPSTYLSTSDCAISILFTESNSRYLDGSQRNPLIHLNLFDLYEVLVFFSWYLPKDNGWKLRNKYIGKSLSNKEVHELFSSVFNIFNDWPNNYLKFLDAIQESVANHGNNTSIESYFGFFYTAIHKHLNNKNTKFIINEFDEYLAKRWDGGYVAILKKSSSKQLNKKFIAVSEVSEIYGISSETVKKYISKGFFKAVIKKRGNSRLILVEKESVEKYKQGLDSTLSTKETSEILGVIDRSLQQLVEFGIIKAIKGPKLDGYPQWRYSKESVYGLLEEIHKKVPALLPKLNNDDLITFRVSLKIAGNLKFGVGQFIMGITNNDIKPVKVVKGEGLGKYMFFREEVRNYFFGIRTKEDSDFITLREMEKIIGVKRFNIADWMNRGFLIHEEGELGEYKTTRQEFERFTNLYVPLSMVARELKTSSTSLYQKLLNNKIVALTGPRIDGGKQYLYLKEEIDNYKNNIGEEIEFGLNSR